MTDPRDNKAWLDALRPPIDEDALGDLRAIILRGLRAALSSRIDSDLNAVTEDFAQDALLKILDGLESFRGESKFTTWAQKIAINVAFTELRRRRWKDISLQDIVETDEGDEYTPALLTDPDAFPELTVEQRNVMEIVDNLIKEELTERQRTAMLAILQGGMPLEEVASRLGTNRNALYKLMHDARQRLQKRLIETSGLSHEEVIALFEEK